MIIISDKPTKQQKSNMTFNPPDVVPLQRRRGPLPTRLLHIFILGCANTMMLLVLLVTNNPRGFLAGGARDLSSTGALNAGRNGGTFWLKPFMKHSKIRNSTKPTLLLHMGPPKTSSTYLQCILTNMMDTLALDNYVFLGLHIEVCKKKKPLLRHTLLVQGSYCNYIFTQPKVAEFNPKFLNELRKTHNQGKNAIIMNECFKFFTPEQTKLVIDEFSSNWNVKLIMNYRRAFEFLPSYYNQGAKPKKLTGNPSVFLWPGETNEENVVGRPLLPFDIEDRGHLTRIFHDMETKGLHPVEETRQQYGEAFPDLTIIKLHELDRSSNSKSGDAVLQEMFCHIVDTSMPHSCAAVQLDETVKIGDLKRNPYYSFNYDNLATAAYEKQLFGFQKKNATTTRTQEDLVVPSLRDVAELIRQLFGFQKKNATPSRRHVAKLIRQHQEDDLNLTHHDFDTTCLAKKKMDRLLNASITSEKVIYDYGGSKKKNWTSQDEVNHQRDFLAYQEKRPYTFCWINTEKTVQDPTWLAFFDSIV